MGALFHTHNRPIITCKPPLSSVSATRGRCFLRDPPPQCARAAAVQRRPRALGIRFVCAASAASSPTAAVAPQYQWRPTADGGMVHAGAAVDETAVSAAIGFFCAGRRPLALTAAGGEGRPACCSMTSGGLAQDVVGPLPAGASCPLTRRRFPGATAFAGDRDWRSGSRGGPHRRRLPRRR